MVVLLTKETIVYVFLQGKFLSSSEVNAMLSPRGIPAKDSTGSQAAKMKETTNQERPRTNESITNSVAANNSSGAPATK